MERLSKTRLTDLALQMRDFDWLKRLIYLTTEFGPDDIEFVVTDDLEDSNMYAFLMRAENIIHANNKYWNK